MRIGNAIVGMIGLMVTMAGATQAERLPHARGAN